MDPMDSRTESLFVLKKMYFAERVTCQEEKDVSVKLTLGSFERVSEGLAHGQEDVGLPRDLVRRVHLGAVVQEDAARGRREAQLIRAHLHQLRTRT